MRKNDKEVIINYDNIIKKSNDISLAKLNYGLSLNQMQLLAFAIFSTQKDGRTAFHKADFEKKFGLDRYKTEHAKQDVRRLLDLKLFFRFNEEHFSGLPVFIEMEYEKGLFQFEWHKKIIPHILELKDKYIVTDLTITSKFKSAFSWILYEYLKSHYGYWHKRISKDEAMMLFGVQDVKSYQGNTALFKKKVLDFAISEINQFTELETWYTEDKKGRAIVGFDLHWSVASKQEAAASDKQVKEILSIIDVINENMWRYLEILDDTDIEKLHMMNTIQKILGYRKTIENILTSKEANKILQDLKFNLRALEMQLDNARRKIGNISESIPEFYNWLEDYS